MFSIYYRYPLLLERLYKSTPSGHQDRDALLNAKNKIESILEHINSVSVAVIFNILICSNVSFLHINV